MFLRPQSVRSMLHWQALNSIEGSLGFLWEEEGIVDELMDGHGSCPVLEERAITTWDKHRCTTTYTFVALHFSPQPILLLTQHVFDMVLSAPMTGKDFSGRVANSVPFSSSTCMRFSIFALWMTSSSSSATQPNKLLSLPKL